MFAAVERFASPIRAGIRIHGFHSVVPVKSTFGSGGTHQPISLEEIAIAKERTDVPAVDALISRGEKLVHFVVALLHRQQDRGFMFKREVFEVESLARSDTNAGKSGANLLVFRR